ncbi:uroporphyrinogen-III C-methyltransferase [Hahella sp. CCB-MM4]|uniref:siroheme synthase CysG n=1 Tax=Hahella sp. (strain CCB-MM4) TaxID=1926491 RepID=UPI000B9A2F83|nr:siroheme synthase CysG [Hahella sp. CCB-MM4]OZG73651.1 uroporphyrinogen-III C-methyltransferase [Hahella sp. CCB-MM4]
MEKQSSGQWDFLPVVLDLRNKPCLVVGEGEQAARKIELLLRAGARIQLVAGEESVAGRELVDRELAENEAVTLVGKSYDESMLQGVALVVAASEKAALNADIAKSCQQRHIPVNVVENPALSSFIFPSIINRHPVLVAVSSSGDAPVLTRLLRNRLESTIPHGVGRLAELAGKYREIVRDKFKHINQRRKFWEQTLEGTIADLVYAGRMDKAEELFQESLEDADFDSKGEVYLVGAGPGDPDLLTFRALRLMRQADVVLYDRLVSPQILDLVRRDAKRIDVGKARSNHTLPQGEINQLLVDLAKEGNRVLRLKGGDPFIFGRGGEEIDRLADAGIPFQVVPGITAAAGCASYSGIPLTHRDCSQSVRFVTGHLKNNTCDLPWAEFVHEHQTLVFYMGLLGLPVIAQQLMAHGMRPDMPVALVSRGTLPDQEVLTGTLADIAEKVGQSQVHGPTIIIIGEVVKLREKLDWMA